MTALAAPDAVEAAARAMQARDPYCYNDGHAPSWDNLSALAKACYSDLATTALAAAAPLIAQQTLLDAAKSAWLTPEVQRWLTARAATLTPKDTP